MRSPCDSGSPPGGTPSASKLRPRRVAGLQQRQVVQHVELQDLQRRLAAVGGHVDEVVVLRLQGGLADHVEIGDDVALARRRRSRSRPRSGCRGPSARCGPGPAGSAPARRPCGPKTRPAPEAASAAAARRCAGSPPARARLRDHRRVQPSASTETADQRTDDELHSQRFYGPHPQPTARVAILRCYSRRAAAADQPPIHLETCHATPLPASAPRSPARPPSRCRLGRAQALEKPKITIAVGGKNLLYYLPLTIAESARLLQGRRARRHDRRLRRRLARAAGGGRRQRRRRLGRVRAHRQHAGQGPAPARLRAAGPRAADRARRQPEDDAQLQVGRRPEGQEDRRHRAGIVDQRDGQLRARQGRPEAERRLDHRRRRRQRRGRARCARARSTPSATSIR